MSSPTIPLNEQQLPTQPPVAEESPEQKYARLYTEQTHQSQEQLLTALQSLQQQVEQLKQPPVEPAPTGNSRWIDRVRQGDFDGAQQIIIDEARRSLKPELDAVRQEAYQQAVNASQLQLEMDRYIQRVRTDNPELVHFERYLEPLVQRRLTQAQSTGKIKSGDDYLREYKAAVDGEVSDLRNASLQLRAAGKVEAQTRNREVLSSTTLQPQQVQINQSQTSEQAPPPDSVEDYFARRRADESRRRGMSV